MAIDTKAVRGSIQPVEAHAANNIMRMVGEWNYRTPPKDYIKEGDGYVWDNAAIVVPDSALVDGDPSTSTGDVFTKAGANQLGRTFYFDLGRVFSASRLVFYPRQEGEDETGHPYKDRYLRAYDVYISDGKTYDLTARPMYMVLVRNPRNTRSMVDIPFPLQPLRFIKLRSASKLPFEIAEVELYGAGFASKAEYVSKVISLEGTANYGKLGWRFTKWRRSGEDLIEDPTAPISMKVETRSGTDDTPERYLRYTEEDTAEVTREEWAKLPPGERNADTYDREHWSVWSAPHSVSGEQITSPSPRRYFQFRITLQGNPGDVMAGGRLDSLWLEYSTPPLAQRVVGEIALQGGPAPPENITTVVTGERTTFTYDVRAQFRSSEYGFDALRIDMPSPATFRGLEMGTPLVPVSPDSVDTSHPGYLIVYFPSNRIAAATNTPLRVIFDTAVLVYGTVFTSHVFDTLSDELPQPVDPGDANEEVDTNALKVLVTQGSLGKIITSFDVSPNPITSNNDGVNDRATINYTLAQLIFDGAPVSLGIYDLSGKSVRVLLSSAGRTNGVYTETWDGRDEGGEMVPPGVYLCKISTKTDTKHLEQIQTIGVVY